MLADVPERLVTSSHAASLRSPPLRSASLTRDFPKIHPTTRPAGLRAPSRVSRRDRARAVAVRATYTGASRAPSSIVLRFALAFRLLPTPDFFPRRFLETARPYARARYLEIFAKRSRRECRCFFRCLLFSSRTSRNFETVGRSIRRTRFAPRTRPSRARSATSRHRADIPP